MVHLLSSFLFGLVIMQYRIGTRWFRLIYIYDTFSLNYRRIWTGSFILWVCSQEFSSQLILAESSRSATKTHSDFWFLMLFAVFFLSFWTWALYKHLSQMLSCSPLFSVVYLNHGFTRMQWLWCLMFQLQQRVSFSVTVLSLPTVYKFAH